MIKIFKYSLILCFALALTACQKSASLTQEQLQAFAESAELNYQVLSNFQTDVTCKGKSPCFKASLKLNTSVEFKHDRWTIFFSHTRPIFATTSAAFNVEHINGDLHKITPKEDFTGFEPKQNYQIELLAEGWFVSETDVMPNYYIVAEGLEPQILEASESSLQPGTMLEIQPHAVPFNQAKQYLRKVDDKLQLSTPENTFKRNQQANTSREYNPLRIIPKVLSQQFNGKYLNISQGLKPSHELMDSYEEALTILADTGLKTSELGVPIELQTSGELEQEAYHLSISNDAITIRANSNSGVFYGLMTLSQLYQTQNQSLPQVEIFDKPRYGFRGLHLDLARNFQPLATVKLIMQQMAWLKMNKLHLHLADDEGWRLEIPGLPELTEIGAYRCHDPSETQCLLPQLASGPHRAANVNGFYSQQQYIELLKLAHQLQIEVIPSLDMPGHSRAAVKAMLARYQKLILQEQREQAEEFLLTDLQDDSQYRSIQYYNDNTINPCIDSSYHFIRTVLTQVQQMHDKANHPLRRYHIGADETAGAWSSSPACKALTLNNPKLDSAEKLTGYFIERVAAMISDMGIIPAGWSDGMSHVDSSKLMGKAQANIWSTLDHNATELAHSFIHRNWDVVLSLPEVLYFDFPYAVDPKEPGYYWASRQTDSYQVFEFMPDNLPAHQSVWLNNWGEELKIPHPIKRIENTNVTGIQAQLWSELVRSPKVMQYMLFPRLAAVAERAWHRAYWEPDYWRGAYQLDATQLTAKHSDWQAYSHHLLRRLLPEWQKAGITFRLPPPGVKITPSTTGVLLQANNLYRELQIEYQLPGQQWQHYKKPLSLTKDIQRVKLRSRLANMQRHSRIIEVNTHE